jgi:hypothetical protein
MPTRPQKQDGSLLKETETQLMALSTMFEAARVGQAGASLALMADKIKQMIRNSATDSKKTKRPNRA